jgi:hypothetical protein
VDSVVDNYRSYCPWCIGVKFGHILYSVQYNVYKQIINVFVYEYAYVLRVGMWFMLLNATFNKISTSVIPYRGDQFYWWRNPEYTEKTIDLSQVTDKLYHIMLYWVGSLRIWWTHKETKYFLALLLYPTRNTYAYSYTNTLIICL